MAAFAGGGRRGYLDGERRTSAGEWVRDDDNTWMWRPTVDQSPPAAAPPAPAPAAAADWYVVDSTADLPRGAGVGSLAVLADDRVLVKVHRGWVFLRTHGRVR